MHQNRTAIQPMMPTEILLAFASQLSNNESAFFTSCKPKFLPILDNLYRLLHSKPKSPLIPPSSKNVLYLHSMYHPQDIPRLLQRRFYEEHCQETFKMKAFVDKFIICYHRDKNLKEYLSPSSYKPPSPNENISFFFKA